jgi:hypothetical protein
MPDNSLLPDRLVAQRYNVHVRTLVRWDQTPSLEFPPPIRIRGRRYRSAQELAAWEAARMARLVEPAAGEAAATQVE